MDSYLGSRAPRRLFAAAGTGLGLANGVFTGIEVDVAPPLQAPPPAVDRLAVTVVTDSYHHNFEPSGRFGTVAVERFQLPPTSDPPRRVLQNEWGLSLHVESVLGDEARRVLVDFGYTHETLANNLELIGIDVARLDALVLSHGHYDHFGGMAGFLVAHRRKLKPALPLYLGGEECFCARETGSPEAPRNFGVLDRRRIAEANLRVLFADRPALLAGHGFTSGWIPKVSFETPAQPSRMRVGLDADGLGCAAARLPLEKRSATLLVDDFQHEIASCYHVKDRGLVVMTSCGHRGVVNTVMAAKAVSGITRVHAIIGGFHIMPMPADYAQRTAQALAELEPDFLIPMHCSGETFIEAAKAALPGKVLRNSTGTRFVFGA
ncbi:MAG TPA: MBL fold metallo-hydrolase [Burkholderiales bacterium]|nr:MBL fold metallo-hydrolase [Burkholderiales bacterium]